MLRVDGDGDAVGGREQRDPGHGEGVEDRGSGASGPSWGQWKRELGRPTRSLSPRNSPSSIMLRGLISRCRDGTWRRGDGSGESLGHYSCRLQEITAAMAEVIFACYASGDGI